MTGPLIYVMGPSGAGKDSVLERARSMLSIETPVAFAHRYITRPADVGGENHVALTRAEFALRRAHGLFAFHWHAHGNDYGIGREIEAWRAAGLSVVVSGSREHYEKVTGSDPDLHPVLITAAIDREARQGGERPAGRGLAKHAEIAHLQRPVDETHELAAQQIGDRRPLAVIADASGQGEVEAPFLEHVGIAPAQQQLFLARRQAGRATARQLSLVGGLAKLVELDDAAIGEILQLGRRLAGHQRHEARHAGEHH